MEKTAVKRMCFLFDVIANETDPAKHCESVASLAYKNNWAYNFAPIFKVFPFTPEIAQLCFSSSQPVSRTKCFMRHIQLQMTSNMTTESFFAFLEETRKESSIGELFVQNKFSESECWIDTFKRQC